MGNPVAELARQVVKDSPYEGYLVVPVVSISQAMEIMQYFESLDLCDPGDMKFIQYEEEDADSYPSLSRFPGWVDAALVAGILVLIVCSVLFPAG